MTFALTIAFGVTTVLGAAATVLYGIRTSHLQKRLKTLDWADITMGTSDLARRVRREFQPEVIFAPSLRGAMIAYFVSEHLLPSVPIIVGIVEWNDDPLFDGALEDFDTIVTNKWHVHVPRSVYSESHRRLLIV